MIINKKITEAIRLLKCFDKVDQWHYLGKIEGLCNADKGFIIFYLGLNKVN